MKNVVESNIKKMAFQVARNTFFKEYPEHFKDLCERALNTSKTKEIPFLHSKVNGLILPPYMTEEQVRIYTTFQTRPGDVFLVTYPKSGTTWLAEIIRCIAQPKESDKENLIGGPVPTFDMATQEQLEAVPSPRYMSTHLPFSLLPRSSEHEVKYIYLARNPKDVAVSYFHFSSMPFLNFDGTWEEFLQYFMKGNIPGGSYFDHVLEWWSHQDDENILFLKYEDLKKDLKSQVKIIAEFLGFKFSDEEAKAVVKQCTFQAMKSNSNQDISKFVDKLFKKGSHLRKGIVGDWKNHFSDEQLEEFDKLYQSRLNGTGLKFEFQSVAE
ncbi:MAG: sulfotransferase domain-containing protein [Xenococcaceae cyanobacterium MO_167.B27]|nr:sulfotransferase domain-containing protein [Xenococcaceae cyanobacterium MO_167.B27]